MVATNVDAGDATGLTRIVVFRYSPTGTLDTGFGANGVFEVPVPNVTNASASTVHLQKSWRIVVVGSANDTTGPSLLAVGIKP